MCRDSRWQRSWPVLWCLPSRRRAWGAGGEGGPWKGMERCYYYYRQRVSACCCGRVYCSGDWVRTEKLEDGSSQVHTHARPVAVQACSLHANSCSLADSPCPSALPRDPRDARPPMTHESRPHSKEDIKTSLRPHAPARERMARAPRLRQKCLVRNGRSQPDDRRVDVGAGGREANAVLLLLLVPQRPGVASRGEQSATTGAIRPPAPTRQSCRVLVAHRPTLCGRRGGGCVHPLSWSHCLK